MRGIRRFGVLALATVMLSPFVPASISHASGGETVTISGLDPVAANASDTFSVSLSGFDNTANYIVVLTVSDGTLTVAQSGSATALFGYDAFAGDPSSVTSDEIGFEGSHSEITTMLGSVVFTASGTLGEPDLSVSVAEKPDGANIYYWPGDDSADSARYYRYVADANVTWTNAEASARSTSSPDNRLGGISGYLLRPSTYEENQFISDKIDARNIWIAARRGTATGTSTADDWFWITHTGTNGPSSSENGVKFYDENWSGTWTSDQSKSGFVDSTLWNNPDGTFVTPWSEAEPNGTNNAVEFYGSTNYDDDNDGVLDDDEKALWNDFRDDADPGGGATRITGYVVEYNAHEMTTLASDVATTTATVASAPDAPGAPSVTVAPGQATVSWTAPDSNYSTITGYTATASPTGGGSSETCTTATTSCVITGLTASTSYSFTVTATNAMGTSAASTATSQTIPADPVVDFDSNTGTGTMSDQVGNTATALTANTFERANFSFVGWNTEADGSGTDYADGATYAFDSDLTLYAQWKKTLPPHIAANDAFVQPGSTTGGTASVLILKNAFDNETSIYNRVGYARFEYDPNYSWTSAAFEMLVSSNEDGVTPNGYGTSYTTFNVDVWGMSNAEWDDTITFTSANASTEDWGIDTSQWPWEPEGGTYLGAFSVPTDPDTIGDTFSLSNADLVTFLNGDTDGEVTLFFRRSDTDNQGNLSFASVENTTTGYHGPRLVVPGGSYSYTLAYDVNGGTGSIPDPGTYTQGGSAYTIADGTNITPPTGETFAGWNTKADGSGTSYPSGASYSTAASVTLYAQYSSDPVVTFNSNDGQSNRAFQVVPSGVTEALDSTPFVRSGYSFQGWSTLANGSGTDYANEADVTLTGNLTLYAQWEATSSGGTSGGSDDEDPGVSELPQIPRTLPGAPPRAPGLFPRPSPGQNGPIILNGPTETPGNPNGPLTTPRGFVGGQPVPTETSEDDDGGVTVTTGTLRLGLRPVPIPGEPGLPGTGGMGMPVPQGGSTEFKGGGLLPGSQLQVFLTGGSQRELGRIPVSPTGEFDGEVQFGTPRGERPLPIGTHVVQAIGYDAEGNQTVVEVPINIAQGPATPEADRASGELPNLPLGTSTATSGGDPIDVAVTGIPETKTVTIDGGDFGFVIRSDGGAQVEDTPTSARVSLEASSTVSITGSGLMSETTASVWMFSTPTQLATVQVDASGGITADVLLDPQFIEPGNHTLQIQAVGTDGFIRSFNIGVVIQDSTDLSTASSASTLLWWVAGLFGVIVFLVIATAIWSRWRNTQSPGI